MRAKFWAATPAPISAEVDRIFREWKRTALMDAGVTIQLPETVLIDPDVIAGEDTLIEPGVQLLGKTKIGARCTIRSGSVLSDAVLGDDVTVEAHSLVAESRLDSNVIVGPFARLRGGNHLRSGVRIGNFVELKNSTLGEGTKAMHLTYLGDAKIGSQNQHGRRHHHLQLRRLSQASHHIGSNVFIGSDSALVAPVRVGDGAYHRRGLHHYRKCSRGWFGYCSRPPDQQKRLGLAKSAANSPPLRRSKKTAAKKSRRTFKKTPLTYGVSLTCRHSPAVLK